jgi:hypothetical protein
MITKTTIGGMMTMSENGEITHGPASDYPSEMEETELAAHIALNRAQDRAAAGEWREEARAAYEMCAGRLRLIASAR